MFLPVVLCNNVYLLLMSKLRNSTCCRSMANDLELPDSPKTVIRTYSNAARGPGPAPPPQLQQHQHNNSLLVLAINNNIGTNSLKETEAGVEMASLPTARSLDPRDIQIHHSDERRAR